ncbi:MAG: hypothetical protein RI575_02880 [Balneolaceae bacterium]|nr:hypothetical protein [Balneolaceae bacterium]MDR9408691.1 hypothetical protein [Balneolaceae bacterium]
MTKELGYIIAGILGVAASAGVSFVTGNIWSGFLTAILIGVLYLIIIDRKLIKSLESSSQKVVLRVLIILLVLAQSFAGYVLYDRSQLLEKNLIKTRTSIDQGSSKIHSQEILLDTFKHYYSQGAQSDVTIASSFREVMGDRLHADGTLGFNEPAIDRQIVFKYKIVSPDEIVITASAKISKGENPEFVNVSDETGKCQAYATLTPEGIDYEREN